MVATLSSADVTVKTTAAPAGNSEHIERIGAAQLIPRLERRTIQTFEVTADA
ncbi:hypothetical protein [Pseudarthrobacter sp.]|uniref:hypothetical protein n=1 Tax=Pseudarthrobacter sp. TaxID=1934409 RepID=UPI002FC770A9